MAVVNDVSVCQREMRWLRLLGWAGLVIAGLLLTRSWKLPAAGQWLLQAGLLWWLVCNETWRRLHLNRSPANGIAYATLGWANRLTLLRGGLIAAAGGFLFQPWPLSLLGWLPGLLYMVSAIIDRLDGFVARKSAHASVLGLEIDTRLDALGLAVAPLLAVWYGQIHWSYLLVSAAYYLFQWGIHRRQRRGLPVYSLPPTVSRRALAGFQMGFVAVALLPVFRPPVTTVAGFAFMLPLLAGFVSDWLTVSGRIDRHAPATESLFTRVDSLGRGVLLPGLRILVVVLLVLILQQKTIDLMPGNLSGHAGLILVYGMALTGGLILLGAAGRLAALALIGLLGWHYSYHAPGIPEYLLLCGVVWLLLFGSGRFSLWSADEDWVNRYDGAR